MKILFVLCAFALVATVLGQTSDSDRRGRLRSLISSARSGDSNAKKTLQDLRAQLRERRISTGASRRAPRPEVVVEATTFHPIVAKFQTIDNEEPQIVIMEPSVPVVKTPVVTEIPFVTQAPIQQSRRTSSRLRSSVADQVNNNIMIENRPHRTLHRDLEETDRSELNVNIKVTNETKTPPIETIRRYAYFDDEGNYIFGYEAADGSFKEEKRGLNCIVQGKYGYIDPDGVKREFTYVSGNKCDNTHLNVDLQGHPVDPPLAIQPRNEQFLHQTQSQQLSETELKQVNVNRRRRPGASRRRRPSSRPVPVEAEVEVSKASEVPHRRFPSFQEAAQQDVTPQQLPGFKEAVQQDATPVRVQPKLVEAPVRTVQPNLFAPVTHAPATKPSAAIRPTPKPVAFNFDQEFKNIFSNFANKPATARTSRPRTLAPVPIPETLRSRPATSAPVVQRTVAPTAAPKPARTSAPKAAPTAKPFASAGHQLVFDAASGTFKTIPLASLVNAQSLPVQAAGKPLPLFTNPLPSVPTGSLMFGASKAGAQNSAAFDNFFKQFTIRQNTI